MQLAGRIEGLLAGPILDQLDTAKEATPPQVTDMGMLAERGVQGCGKRFALHLHPLDQAPVQDGRDDRMGRRR